MRALMLVGGKATRLRPLTERTPKAMTPLLGRPFLEHILAWLVRYDIRDVTMLLGFLAEPIRAYFGDGHHFGVQLTYVVEEQPLGSGGAIKQLERELTETFLALNGDIFTDADLHAMTDAHRRSGTEVSIALTRVEDPTAYGVAAVDVDGRIHRFVEKPAREEAPSDLINAGIWLFEPSAVNRIAAGCFTMVEHDLFPKLAAEGRLLGHTLDAYWMDAGTPERYLQLQRDLLEGRAAGSLMIGERPGWPGLILQPAVGARTEDERPPLLGAGVVLAGPVVLGAGVAVGDGSRIDGPTTVGARSTLARGVAVSDSVLWDSCMLGEGAVVRRSLLAGGCVIGAGAFVDDCVLGDGVHVRSGASLVGRRIGSGESV